jgi:hypothetical protein
MEFSTRHDTNFVSIFTRENHSPEALNPSYFPASHVSKRDAVDIDTNSLGALPFAEQQ